jgi:hypothetical protein
MIELAKSRSGLPSAVVNGIHLHSMYDPRKEALRFIESNLFGEYPDTIVVLGEGLGYITEELQKRFKRAKILSIFFSHEVFEARICRIDACWHPGNDISLFDYFSSNVSDFDIAGLRLLIWEPSLSAFPGPGSIARKAVSQIIREYNGNIITTAAFGKRWVTNSFDNFLHIQDFHSITSRKAPLVIAASGPTLCRSIPLLKKLKNKIRIWALPSSLSSLLNENIIPEMVVLTDPGYYSTLHISPARNIRGLKLAMPLSAAAGAWKASAQICLLSQLTIFEKALINSLNLPSLSVRPNGTVAGTAIEIALESTAPTIFAGLDLCFQDIQDHTRPHAFDALLDQKSFRLNPLYTQIFERLASFVAPGSKIASGIPISMKTYAGWFSRFFTAGSHGVYRINPSPITIANLPEISSERMIDLCTQYNRIRPEDQKPLSMSPPLSKRRSAATDILDSWTQSLQNYHHHLDTTGKIETISQFDVAIKLLYFIEIRNMIEMRKKTGVNRRDEAVEIGKRGIESALQYLSSLRRRVVSA